MGAVFRKHPKQMQPVPSAQVHTEHPAQGFDPRHLSKDLVVWCRADAGVETNGSTVSKWRDVSGRGHDFSQATASSQPTPKKAGQGGRPEIVFDDDKLAGSDLYAMLADKGEWTIFLVLGEGWQDSSTSPGTPGAGGSFSAGPNVLTANPTTGYIGICVLNVPRGGFGGGIYNAGYKESEPVSAGKVGQGDPAIFALYSDSGGIKSRQNGIAGTTGAAADLVSTATTLQLGDAADNNHASDYYDGSISEVMIFNGVITENEMLIVEDYLSDRYSIALTEPPQLSTISIDDDTKLLYPTVMAYTSGPPAGLTRSSGGSDWSCGAASVATITDGGEAYVQCDVTSNQSTPVARHWMIGLGYASSITGTGQTSSNAYAWAEYAVYCWGGVAAAAFASGTLVHGSHPSGGPSGGFAVNRSWRIAVDSDVVTIKYSDDSWSSSTTWYTFSTGLDIATNGPLRASFSINTAGTVIENVKMHGLIS